METKWKDVPCASEPPKITNGNNLPFQALCSSSQRVEETRKKHDKRASVLAAGAYGVSSTTVFA